MLGLADSLCIYLICLFVCSSPLIIPSWLLIPYAPFSKLNSEEYQNVAQGGGLHTKILAHRDSRQTINSVFLRTGVRRHMVIFWSAEQNSNTGFWNLLKYGANPQIRKYCKIHFSSPQVQCWVSNMQTKFEEKNLFKKSLKNSKKIKITKLNSYWEKNLPKKSQIKISKT